MKISIVVFKHIDSLKFFGAWSHMVWGQLLAWVGMGLGLAHL